MAASSALEAEDAPLEAVLCIYCTSKYVLRNFDNGLLEGGV